MTLPLADWQFWAATALCVVALAWMLRGVVPIPILSRRHHRKKRERRVNLTVGGRATK
jgi:hypothetical protein